jgi:hypothetical protein
MYTNVHFSTLLACDLRILSLDFRRLQFHWLSTARTTTISVGHEEAPSAGEVSAAL